MFLTVQGVTCVITCNTASIRFVCLRDEFPSQTTTVYLLHKLRATFSYKSRGQFRFILFARNCVICKRYQKNNNNNNHQVTTTFCAYSQENHHIFNDSCTLNWQDQNPAIHFHYQIIMRLMATICFANQNDL